MVPASPRSLTLWHAAARLFQQIGDRSERRARNRALASLDPELRKDIGWPAP